MFTCCFGKKKAVSVRHQPILTPPMSSQVDFRPPLDVSPSSYSIGEDDDSCDEEEGLRLPPSSDSALKITILDILGAHDDLDKNQKYDLEAKVNLIDWKSILDDSDKKAKFDPVLYNSELVFNTVKEYDRVFPMRNEKTLDKERKKIFGLF